jgi:hypothetical protein
MEKYSTLGARKPNRRKLASSAAEASNRMIRLSYPGYRCLEMLRYVLMGARNPANRTVARSQLWPVRALQVPRWNFLAPWLS